MSCGCKALVFVERGPSSPHLRCWFAAGPEIEPPATWVVLQNVFRLANGDFVPVSIHCADTVLHRGLDVACVLRNAATSIIIGMHSGCMKGCVEGRVCHLCWDNTSYPHHAEGQSKLAASVRVNFLKDNRMHRILTSVFVTLCVLSASWIWSELQSQWCIPSCCQPESIFIGIFSYLSSLR